VPFSGRAYSKGTIRVVPYPPPAFHLQIIQARAVAVIEHYDSVESLLKMLSFFLSFCHGQSLAASAQASVIDRSGGGTCPSTRANTISDLLLDVHCVKSVSVLNGKRLQYDFWIHKRKKSLHYFCC
jgi:hypothetical protein